MQLKLGNLNRMCSDMEGLWRTHHSKPQRELWRRSVLCWLVLSLCTHAPMHPCTHAPMHPCTHAPMHPCTHAPMHPCTHAPCDHMKERPVDDEDESKFMQRLYQCWLSEALRKVGSNSTRTGTRDSLWMPADLVRAGKWSIRARRRRRCGRPWTSLWGGRCGASGRRRSGASS